MSFSMPLVVPNLHGKTEETGIFMPNLMVEDWEMWS